MESCKLFVWPENLQKPKNTTLTLVNRHVASDAISTFLSMLAVLADTLYGKEM